MVSKELEAAKNYGVCLGEIKGIITQIRHHSQFFYNTQYQKLPLSQRKYLRAVFRLENYIQKARESLKVCRSWVDFYDRCCDNCTHYKKKYSGCSDCLRKASPCNWEPKEINKK